MFFLSVALIYMSAFAGACYFAALGCYKLAALVVIAAMTASFSSKSEAE